MHRPSLIAAKALKRMEQALMQGFTTVRDAGGADYGFGEAAAPWHPPGPRFLSSRSWLRTGGREKRRRPSPSSPSCVWSHGRGHRRRARRGPQGRRERLAATWTRSRSWPRRHGPPTSWTPLRLTVEEMRAAVEEAQAVGKYFLAHASSRAAVRRALQAGDAA